MDSPHRVLVVDDDDSIRNLLLALLRRKGFVCDDAADGEVAMAHLERQRYSLILLDLMMPRMDGFEVIRELRMLGNTTPIVVVTAAGAARVNTLDPNQVKAVLSKPFEISQLVDTVVSLCNEHEPLPAPATSQPPAPPA
jgi:DNA-binding response OmpR family regulator